MTTDIIAARRQALREAAPCEYCGATLAACKAQRGKDPTAPEWFGCCAHGLGMEPCHHAVDRAALSELLDEIEAGHVRTVEEVEREAQAKKAARGMSWSEYFDQGEWWHPDRKPRVRIADMDETWRYNASRFLERHAGNFAHRYTTDTLSLLMFYMESPLGPSEDTADQLLDGIERETGQCTADPVGWIRGTALYRALVADLPAATSDLAAIAGRAKHWSTCPVRSGGDGCRCGQIRAEHKAAEVAS